MLWRSFLILGSVKFIKKNTFLHLSPAIKCSHYNNHKYLKNISTCYIEYISIYKWNICRDGVLFMSWLISSWTKWLPVRQTTFSNAFAWIEMIEFRFKCHWNLFPGVQLTISQHWFRLWLGAKRGAVSIRKTVLPGMAIPMLKIRRPNGRLIFNMEIAIHR